MEITIKSENKVFNGIQGVYSHQSTTCKCEMTFAVFIPKKDNISKFPFIWYLSGLTCTHENAMTKSGAQYWAAQHGVALIFPDTSPRGKDVSDDPSFDLGQGAGFYLDAVNEPWKKNFQMWSYINDELPKVVIKNFPVDSKNQAVMGHSMGGLGALNCAIKNPERFKSVSALAPICNPVKSEWGQRQFSAYLGDSKEQWESYDPTILLSQSGFKGQFLIDQGKNDNFLELLKPESLETVIKNQGLDSIFRYHEGYDHSYFFVASFIGDHIQHHSNAFQKK